MAGLSNNRVELFVANLNMYVFVCGHGQETGRH